MTIQEATDHALSAARDGDLREVARAVAARGVAITQAVAIRQPPAPHALARLVEEGDRLLAALKARRRELTLEKARLERIQSGFFSVPARTVRISLRG